MDPMKSQPLPPYPTISRSPERVSPSFHNRLSLIIRLWSSYYNQTLRGEVVRELMLVSVTLLVDAPQTANT